MRTAPTKIDISLKDGGLIVAEAATWKGTPYNLNGPGAVKGIGGDCSGITWKVYWATNFRYSTYQTATEQTFVKYALDNGLFRELDEGEDRQDGDILFWAVPGHMAIYSSFTQDDRDDHLMSRTNAQGITWIAKNDMWTAYHRDGPPYGPAEIKYWSSTPFRVFRRQKVGLLK